MSRYLVVDSVLGAVLYKELNLPPRLGLKSREEASALPPLLVLINPRAGSGRGRAVFEERAEWLLSMAGRR